MFVDASALVAMIAGEAEAAELAARAEKHPKRITSPLSVWEAGRALSRVLNADTLTAAAAVQEYLDLAGIQIMSVPPSLGAKALEVHARYGKGCHEADLNFGDCFAYAMARYYRYPMLYKGDDFARTDMEAA